MQYRLRLHNYERELNYVGKFQWFDPGQIYYRLTEIKFCFRIDYIILFDILKTASWCLSYIVYA